MAKTGQQEVLAEQRQTPQQQVEAQLVSQQADADRFAKQAATLRSQATALKTTGVGGLANIKKRDDLNAQAAAVEAQHAAALGQLQATATLYRGAYGNGPANSSIAKIVSSFGAKSPLPMTQPAASPAPAPAAVATPAPAAATSSLPPSTAGVGTKENPQYVAPAPTTNPGSVEDQIRRQYGYMAWALDDPELGPLLRQGIAEGWDIATLQGHLNSTNVWHSTDQAQRDWLALKGQGDASAENAIRDMSTAVIAAGKTTGITINPERARQIAELNLSNGWRVDSTQFREGIAAEFRYAPGAQTGALAQAETTLKKMASDYLVPLSDAALAGWEQQIAAGTATPETFRSTMVAQAKGLFPTMAKQLDQGLTTDQLVDPYRQLAVRELDVSPDSIDFTQPKWMAALNAPTDPKTGERQMLGLGDWLTKLRSDDTYGWDRTVAGKTAYTQMGNALTQALGLRPGG